MAKALERKSQMSQSVSRGYGTNEREKAAVVVEEFEQRRLLRLVCKPVMWRSVALPELADLVDSASGAIGLGRFL